MTVIINGLNTRERILGVCAKLFLEKGYKKTTVAEITRQAKASNSSFQHFFGAKDGALTELVKLMYPVEFNASLAGASQDLPPMYVYVAGAVVQLTVTELNENLREVYVEAYAHEETLSFIQTTTAQMIYEAFGSYRPELTLDDFRKLLVGTTGMMRGYMARPCDENFTLEQKLRSYVDSEMRVYGVPEPELQGILDFVEGLDSRSMGRAMVENLFQALGAESSNS